MSLFSKPTLNLSVPEELMAVLHYYEDTCVMGCCGIDALNLDVQRAIDGMMEAIRMLHEQHAASSPAVPGNPWK